jgi:nucleotide-binding universal stress UspA family protein
VGIDGSEEALSALRKAAVWSRSLEASLSMVAVYDPFFHSMVFKTMACSLSAERKEEVGLSRQEDLHERIIDSGLHALYAGFLDRAREITRALNVDAQVDIIRGKAYRALVDYLDGNGATLAVVGRHGHHRETISSLGSNAEAVVRLSGGNVLVTASDQPADSASQRRTPGLEWDEEALARLDRVPSFARTMARKGVEDHARAKGESKVTLQLFFEFSQKIGMIKEKNLK